MRLDRATCAICMDSLFNKLDDLDELVPIVAPACGHIFHEECIHAWFKSQETTYIANARAHGDFRDSSPHASDAPAECPTCRQECFVNDAGEFETMRLYINWADQDGSMAGSSPIRPTQGRKGPDELMMLARRAKALGAEAGDMSAESRPEDVQGMQRRAEGLKQDLGDQKGVEGIRRYVGGLTAALNKLSANLESNPLSADLRMQLAAQEHKVAEQERRLRDMVQRIVPDQIAAAKRAEREAAKVRNERLQKEADRLQQAVQEQRVLKASLVKSHAAKMEDLEAKLATAEENAQKERECRQSLQEDLKERTSQLRVMQAKAKSRKDLKVELEDTKAELARLRSEHEKLSKRPSSTIPHRHSPATDTPSPCKKRRKSSDQDELEHGRHSPCRSSPLFGDSENDISIRELSPTTFSQNLKSTHRAKQGSDAADESLFIDMESLERPQGLANPPVSDFFDEPLGTSKRVAARGNTTARSFTSDQFARPSARAEGTKSSSKYFSTQPSGSRTNPFSSTKSDSEKRKQLPRPSHVIVPASSDNEEEHHRHPRPLSPRRVVPMPSARPLPSPKIGSKTTSLSKDSSSSQPSAGGKKQSAGQVGIAQALGLADKNGRPMKGTAMGAKAGRRA